MDVVLLILRILMKVLTAFWVIVLGWQLIVGLCGLLPLKNKFRQKQGKVQRTHRFAAVICARNEELVIGKLIESLQQQNYPAECLHIFVVADNCTDNTADAARRAGAEVFVRNDTERVGKGHALRYAVDRLRAEYPDRFDALAVFDADNLVSEDFFWSANRALCDDADVVTGNRIAKNPYDTWVSGCYSIFWNITMRLFDDAHNKIGLSSFVHGTGFVTRMELIKDGWETVTITEDGEFSCIQKCRGRRIVYVEEAEYYDEQPTRLKHFFMQFYRWEVGGVQGLRQLFRQVCAALKNHPIEAIDSLLFLLLPAALSALILSSVLMIVMAALSTPLATSALVLLISVVIGIVPVQMLALYMTATCGLDFRRRWKSIVFFPLFTLPMSVLALGAVLRPRVKWRAIPHTDASSIDEVREKTGRQ